MLHYIFSMPTQLFSDKAFQRVIILFLRKIGVTIIYIHVFRHFCTLPSQGKHYWVVYYSGISEYSGVYKITEYIGVYKITQTPLDPLCLRSALFNSHRKSGDCDGRCKVVILWWVKTFLVDFDGCLRSLSFRKINLWPRISWQGDSRILAEMFMIAWPYQEPQGQQNNSMWSTHVTVGMASSSTIAHSFQCQSQQWQHGMLHLWNAGHFKNLHFKLL